jgi:hypothetical protein
LGHHGSFVGIPIEFGFHNTEIAVLIYGEGVDGAGLSLELAGDYEQALVFDWDSFRVFADVVLEIPLECEVGPIHNPDRMGAFF